MSAFIDNTREKVLFGVIAVALAGLLVFLFFAWPDFRDSGGETNDTGEEPVQELALPEMLPHSPEEYQQALDVAHAFTAEYLTVEAAENFHERNVRLAQFATPNYAEFLENETPPQAAQDDASTGVTSDGRTQHASISELDHDSLTFSMRTTSTVTDAEGSREEQTDFLVTVEVVDDAWGVSSLRPAAEGTP